MLKSGTLLKNRYLIISLLGRGGMGEVYLAEDKSLSSNKVAVKKVLYSDDEDLLKASEKEASVLAKLRHPNLPKVLNYFNEDNTQFIVMEYITGKDLDEMLQINQSPFSIEQVMIWADSLVNIVEYLHKQTPSVVHRDIKPKNVKIDDEGQLILIDFGLVKDTPTRIGGSDSSKSTFGFSESYAPLEQINGDPTSTQTDIYGLCATLYHLLTNVKPADALNRATKVVAHKRDSLRPAHEINQNVPLALSQVLEDGLRLNSDERIKTVQELRERLNLKQDEGRRIHINIDDNVIINQDDSTPKPIPTPPKVKGGNWKVYTAGALAIVALVFGGVFIYQWINKPEVEAAELRDDAEKIERSEGLLNQIACSKYQEIQTKYSQTSVAKKLVGKANACTTAQSLLEQTEKLEKEDGLTFKTIEAYKKIVESYSGTYFAKKAEKKITEFEKNKQATLNAWNEKQNIDNSQFSGELSQKFDDALGRYSKIILDSVDPLLAENIKNSISILMDGKNLAAQVEQEADNITEAKKKEVEEYCTKSLLNTQSCINDWWSINKDGQQRGAMKSAQEKYKDKISSVKEKLLDIIERNKTISSQLNEKYKVDFINRTN